VSEIVLGGPALLLAIKLRMFNVTSSVAGGALIGVIATAVVKNGGISLHEGASLGAIGGSSGFLFWSCLALMKPFSRTAGVRCLLGWDYRGDPALGDRYLSRRVYPPFPAPAGTRSFEPGTARNAPEPSVPDSWLDQMFMICSSPPMQDFADMAEAHEWT